MTDPVLVIGDVHGHPERLAALMAKAREYPGPFTTIQLGDLGHFGAHTREGDLECWRLSRDGLVDTVLWGNHDRAVVDPRHLFGGYADPRPETLHLVKLMQHEGRLKMAAEAHGWLVTHAGLHAHFRQAPARDTQGLDKDDPAEVARWLNANSGLGNGPLPTPFVDAVGGRRGGASSFGGVLWRDVAEKLWDEFPQVFGHSASPRHEVRGERDRWWCVDVGGKGDREGDDCLAAVWLPSQETLRVDL